MPGTLPLFDIAVPLALSVMAAISVMIVLLNFWLT